MRKTLFMLASLVLVAALAACDGISVDLSGSGSKPATGASQSSLPQSFIDSPADGSNMPMAPIEINYRATNTTGVAAVELSIDGQVVNTYALPDPKQAVVAVKYAWQPLISGSHAIRVRARSFEGNWGDFATAIVAIQQPAAAPAQPAQPPAAQPTQAPPPTAVPTELAIVEVTKSAAKFYHSSNTCGPMELTLTMRVNLPDKVWSVVVFTRMADQEEGGLAKWDAGHAMNSLGNGVYSIKLNSSTLTNGNLYDRAEMRYQFVGTDKNRNNVLRSEVFYDVELWRCP